MLSSNTMTCFPQGLASNLENLESLLKEKFNIKSDMNGKALEITQPSDGLIIINIPHQGIANKNNYQTSANHVIHDELVKFNIKELKIEIVPGNHFHWSVTNKISFPASEINKLIKQLTDLPNPEIDSCRTFLK